MTTWAPFFAQRCCPCGQCHHQKVTWLLLSMLQTSGTCLRNLHRNSPEPSGTRLRNLRQHTAVLSGNHAGLLREPSGTCLRNLHQRTPDFFGNLPEPASGTYTSTHRNSPEPASGTCSCDPHRHTPELIWAEDPISLRCWEKTYRV